jgi:uncharacterized protein YlxW (UPF0749 family)
MTGVGVRPAPAQRRGGGTRLLALALLALLGFGLAVGVRAARRPAALTSARSEDLVRLLDDLDAQRQRLREQLTSLQQSRDRLAGASGGATVLAEARDRAGQLGVLAGTAPARGPGVVLTIADPQAGVRADVIVDTVQELRDAGAEAIDVSGVRLGLNSFVLDSPGGISVDGRSLSPPYRVTAIGDPATLAPALRIPGGVVDTVASRPGAGATIENRPLVDIGSLRALPGRTYASPAAH